MKEKRVNELIRQCLNEFINEELSISDDVNRYVESVCDDFLAFNRNDEFFYYDECVLRQNPDTILCKYRKKTFVTSSEIFAGQRLSCVITLLDFDNINDMIENYPKTSEYNQNGFDEFNFKLSVSARGYNGYVDLKMLKHILFHEAEHAYQYCRSYGQILNNNVVYNKAKQIILGKDMHHTDFEYQIVADLLYYFDKREIDANVNGLYGELKLDGNYKETMFRVTNDYYNNLFDKFIIYSSNIDFSTVLSYFGFSMTKFMNYIKAQQKYVESKIRKIMAKISIGKQGIVEVSLKRPIIK